MYMYCKRIHVYMYIIYLYKGEDDGEQRQIGVACGLCRVTSDMGIGRAEQVLQQTMFVRSVDCKG